MLKKLDKTQITQSILYGGLAGLLATFPMTIVMLAGKRLLPPREKYSLPPREITHHLAEKSGQEEAVNTRTKSNLMTSIAHFGYGALTGSIYALLAPSIKAPVVLKGALFGFLLWGGSYLGWLPALGVLSPATQHPKGRVALMILSHLAFGPTTALVYREFQKDRFT
jgi:putative membrane protein